MKQSVIAKSVREDIQAFEKKYGSVKYIPGTMKKFGLKERVIKVVYGSLSMLKEMTWTDSFKWKLEATPKCGKMVNGC